MPMDVPVCGTDIVGQLYNYVRKEIGILFEETLPLRDFGGMIRDVASNSFVVIDRRNRASSIRATIEPSRLSLRNLDSHRFRAYILCLYIRLKFEIEPRTPTSPRTHSNPLNNGKSGYATAQRLGPSSN